MVLEGLFPHFLTAKLAFKEPLGAFLQVDLYVSLLNQLTTAEWTLQFKLVYKVLNASVLSKPQRKRSLANRTWLVVYPVKARLTEDVTAPLTVERLFR